MNFALISEGITDQVVIESIIGAFYRDSDEEITVNPLQPMRDATDQSRQDDDSFGGWEKVFEYISTDDNCAAALDANERLVIQVDSDICWHESININPNNSCEILIGEIRDLLISKIPSNIINDIRDYLIFAIPIHSTECWLIPIYTQDQIKIKKTNNCEKVLKSIEKDVGQKVEKTYDCYKKLSAKIKKAKDINLISRHNNSLQLFINQLPPLLNKDLTSSENEVEE